MLKYAFIYYIAIIGCFVDSQHVFEEWLKSFGSFGGTDVEQGLKEVGIALGIFVSFVGLVIVTLFGGGELYNRLTQVKRLGAVVSWMTDKGSQLLYYAIVGPWLILFGFAVALLVGCVLILLVQLAIYGEQYYITPALIALGYARQYLANRRMQPTAIAG